MFLYTLSIMLLALLGTLIVQLSTGLLPIGSIADIISAIGSLLTAIIAFIALCTWKVQFNHARKYDYLTDLESTINELHAKFTNYSIVEVEYVVRNHKLRNQTELLEFNTNREESRKEFLDYRCTYMAMYSDAVKYIDKKHSSKIMQQHESFMNALERTLAFIDSNHDVGYDSNFDSQWHLWRKKISTACKSYIEKLWELRK
jgi:hypothetical protein